MKRLYDLPFGGYDCDGKFFLSSIIYPPISDIGGTNGVD